MIIIKGDVNLDGKIDADDLMLLYLAINSPLDVQIQAGTPSFIAGDIDNDGVLTMDDYESIYAHIRGEKMITEVLEIDGI